MRLFLISCTSLLLVFSCVTQKKANDISWEYNNYTNSQKELINTGKSDDPMRIFLITNKQDSILLRTKSNRINLNKDLETTKLLSQRLLSTVQDPAHAGVGIAAPQVGILKNMIVVQRYDKEGFPFETYINPTIKQYSKNKISHISYIWKLNVYLDDLHTIYLSEFKNF